MSLELVARLIILVSVIVVSGWDIGVILMGRPDATISAVLLQLSKENPIIAFMLGVIIGHLFWPNFKGH
jgi:predicted permease|tara:strand:- start:288 stop:494 length:207 start_codon:yes stop_codon:yes gene_type:complete